MKFVDVIVPLPLPNRFTYLVPKEMEKGIDIGTRVIVPFGKRKMYTAIVVAIHTTPPQRYDAKELIELLDKQPIVRKPQLEFWKWISQYYLCSEGEVLQAAIPTGLKIESQTQVIINPNYTADTVLTEKELTLLDCLSDGKIHTVQSLSKVTTYRDTLSVVKSLLQKEAVEVSEEWNEKYRAKKETYVKLTPYSSQEQNLKEIFETLERAKKQSALLLQYLTLSNILKKNTPTVEVSQKELLAHTQTSAGVLNALIDKNILTTYTKTVGRLNNEPIETIKPSTLTSPQQVAYEDINRQFTNKETVLLYGVTSSGKTEIYIQLILETLAQKKQALYLVPEIALTTQLTNRLKKIFGNKLGIYHSKFSDAERVEIWNNLLNDQHYEVIIGVRSSIFLPFRQLGLIIVDEEHETSYKQHQPAPRYHARNAAIVLATMHHAKTLLGTATPSIESYHNTQNGKYGLVTLDTRYKEIALPHIIVENTREAYRKKQMQGNFTPLLKEKIEKALQQNEQVILFQNRRGYAPYLECKGCAYVPKCQNCDVSLTLHKHLNQLTCHYCGYIENQPHTCPVCHTPQLRDKGIGTQKIEEQIKEFFPTAKVQRMDFDTTRSKKSYENIIANFESGKTDILIGTQMVTKGLDFERVSLVGILNADNMLNFPDFRADERAFQLIEQVSGRAGRKHKRGTVILQTSQPQHPIIEQVVAHDYLQMYHTQCDIRQTYHYPPYYRLIEINVKHRKESIAQQAAERLATLLKNILHKRVQGPNKPAINRVKNFYINQLFVKIEPTISYEKVKTVLQEHIDFLRSQDPFKSTYIQLDIDPN